MLLKGNIFPIFRNLSSVLVRVSMSQILISTTYDGTASFHSGTTNSVLLSYPQLRALCPLKQRCISYSSVNNPSQNVSKLDWNAMLEVSPLGYFLTCMAEVFPPFEAVLGNGKLAIFSRIQILLHKKGKGKEKKKAKERTNSPFLPQLFSRRSLLQVTKQDRNLCLE